jgi:hypothetical protein
MKRVDELIEVVSVLVDAVLGRHDKYAGVRDLYCVDDSVEIVRIGQKKRVLCFETARSFFLVCFNTFRYFQYHWA